MEGGSHQDRAREEDRSEDAVELLQQVMSDDPDHEEAQSLLVDHLERSGRGEELVALLRQQLASAQERKDAGAVKAASLRLGRRVEGESPDDGLAIYRSALEWAPEDAELLAVILSRLDEEDDLSERALLTERLAISYGVVQVLIGSVCPFFLLMIATRPQLPPQMMTRLSGLAGVLVLVQVLAMRWNIVVGGQLFSKSFRGFVEFPLHWTGREGLIAGAVILALPLLALWVAGKLLPLWSTKEA